MPDYLLQAIEFIREMPTVIKFLSLVFCVFIEYIFPIFPGDTIVLMAGFLNAHDAVDLMDILFAILIGSLLGALVAYQIGYALVTKKINSPWLNRILEGETLGKFNYWYQKWGSWFILTNRFFPGIRALFFFAAGINKLSRTRVLILGGISAILFNGCLIALGYALGFKADLILQYFYQYSAAALVLTVLVIAIAGFFVWQNRRRE